MRRHVKLEGFVNQKQTFLLLLFWMYLNKNNKCAAAENVCLKQKLFTSTNICQLWARRWKGNGLDL